MSTCADSRITVVARCEVHGPMHHDQVTPGQWACHGWDGEGCTAVLRYEDVLRACTSTAPHTEYWMVVPRSQVAGSCM